MNERNDKGLSRVPVAPELHQALKLRTALTRGGTQQTIVTAALTQYLAPELAEVRRRAQEGRQEPEEAVCGQS